MKHGSLKNKLEILFSRKTSGLTILLALAACGGGESKIDTSTSVTKPDQDDDTPIIDPPNQPEVTTRGQVIDGYISGSRVYRDLNSNGIYDPDEPMSLTDNNGKFVLRDDNPAFKLIADHNNYSAIDTSTGLPFNITLEAPESYQVISPLSSVILQIVEQGNSLNFAENAVKSTFSIGSNVNLADYDPLEAYNSSGNSNALAESVLLANVKLANILILSNDDSSTENTNLTSQTIANLADVILDKYANGATIDLSDARTLSNILPASNLSINTIARINSKDDYFDTLDEQIGSLVGNLQSGAVIDQSQSIMLLAFDLGTNFNREHVFKVELTSSNGSTTIESLELVAIAGQFAVFKFSTADVVSLGPGAVSTKILDENLGSYVDERNDFNISNTGFEDRGTVSIYTDSGIVADGYISNARVFRDEIKNNTYDSGEPFVLTNSDGEFSGLGGSADKPIVVDGNDGGAVDVSTGVTFSAVLSAPAGSKVVNPITTIVNELLQDSSSGATTVEQANQLVANTFGLTGAVEDGSLVDFTKFDAISGTIFNDDDTQSTLDNADMVTATQGVATYVANLVVAGANEKGGDVSAAAATTRSIISNIKEIVKNNQSSPISFTDDNIILDALGSDFNSSSTTLEKMKTDFTGFDPVGDPGNSDFSQDKLIEKQLVAQSEFGDGILTTSEAANGATLVVGPTYDPSAPGTELSFDGDATVKVTNEDTSKIVYKSISFSNSKYASIELSASELNETLGGGRLLVEVKPGSLSGVTWETGGDKIFDNLENKLYFHKGITPKINFDNSTIITSLSDGAAIVTSADSSFVISGTLEIDLGTSVSLPGDITFRHLVDGLDTAYNDGVGRDVTLEFLDSSGKVKYVLKAEVDPTSGINPETSASNTDAKNGVSQFTWTTGSFTASEKSTIDQDVTFGSLIDGSYSIRASFIDAYGAVSDGDASTFSNVIIDRVPPQVSGSIIAGDTIVNASEGSLEFTVNLTQAAASYVGSKIVLNVNNSDKLLSDEITAGRATASFNSSNTALLVNYEPTLSGSVNLKIEPGAFLDARGNESTGSSETSIDDKNQIDYDFVLPTVAISLENSTGALSSSDDELNVNSDAGLKVKFVFSEPVNSFSLSDVSVGQIAGNEAAQLVELPENEQTTDNETWYAGLDLTNDLDGDLTVSVAGGSYTDGYGNLGASGTVTYQQDTASPYVFQIGLKSGTEKATYGYGDAVYIIVTYDSEIESVTESPAIELTIGGETRLAAFVKIDESDASKVHFSYPITKAQGDRSDENGIEVANSISGGTIIGTDGNLASLDLTTASQPIDLSSKVVDASTDGSAVDGYVEGAIIYADNDGTGDLSALDVIAQADATGGFAIYGAQGPLVLEGGFDISTNKDFNVRYKAPGDEVITYTVINPITTLINQVNSTDLATAEGDVRAAIGSPLSSDEDLRSYNAYEAIAEAGDGAADTNAVSNVIADALKYQKAAASTALVVDFIASSAFYATGELSNKSIQEISDDVFEIIGNNLTSFMSLFVGKTFEPFYDDNTGLVEAADNNVSSIKLGLSTLFGSVPGFDVVQIDFSETLDVLATAVAAINSVQFTPPTNSALPEDILLTAEEGIDALTEIVQVQAVVQTDMLSEISNHYDPDIPSSANISVAALLGTSDTNGFPSTPVGTVVPIRYSIEAPTNKSDGSNNNSQFEADENGIAAEYEFNITRSGSVKTNSQLNYEISGSVSEGDIVGGVLSGELFFDVNEKSKTLKISLNNDSLREASETLTVIITDPSGTSQIVEERASVVIKDDDPSTPEITIQRTDYSTSEDSEVFIDDVTVDYFDEGAYFSINWEVDGGTLSTLLDGNDYTPGDFVNFYELQTDLLRNLKFVSNAQTLSSDGGAALITVTAAEKSDGSGRTSFEDFEVTFDVSRKPNIDISSISFDTATSYAGVPMKISGIEISDPDSDFLTVTVKSSINGEISTTSLSNYSMIGQSSNTVSFSGDKNSVRDAISKLTFTAEASDDVQFTLAVDDEDASHARHPNTGDLVNTDTQTRLSQTVLAETASHTIDPSSPFLTQVFEPNLKVGAGFWNGFTGIEVSDLDSNSISVQVSSALDPDNGNAPKVNFRLYDNSDPFVPLIISKANDFTITGSPEFVTDQLKMLQVEMLVNEQDLITFSVYDDDAVLVADKVSLQPSYVAMDNAVPDPGGDFFPDQDQSVSEDSNASFVTFSEIRRFDSDAYEDGVRVLPEKIRILSSVGGEVYQSSGEAVRDLNTGIPQDISLEDNGSLRLKFVPHENFNGEAVINYVVVDPQQPNFTSPISELSIVVTPVNDAPTVSISETPAVYLQGTAPATIFSNVSISDIDSTTFSEVKITSNVDTTKLDRELFLPDGMFDLQKDVDGNNITFYGATLSGSDVASLLSNVKFQSVSNDLVGETRTVTVSVKDALMLESSTVSKTIELIDVNDGPVIHNSSNEILFTEDQLNKVALSDFGDVSDPEDDNILKLVANISNGYKINRDFFDYDQNTNDVTIEFDAASGALSILANTDNGVSANSINSILSSVGYFNTSQNLVSNTVKTLTFEITDVKGETTYSDPFSVTITPVNDIPEIFSVVAGSKVFSGTGPQYVGGGEQVRVAPNVRLSDVDNSNFMAAEISLTGTNGGVLNLSDSGKKLAQALGITYEGDNTSSLSIYDTLKTDSNYISTVDLQSILKEVTYSIPDYDAETSSIEGKSANVSFLATDAAGGVSASYISTLNLLDEPSVDIIQLSISDDTNFSNTTDKDTDTANILKFNSTFFANQLLVDLSSSKIYTEVGRFNYDPNITSLKIPIGQAGHIDLRDVSGVVDITETKIIGQSGASNKSDVIYGSRFDDFIDGNGGLDTILAGMGNDTVALRQDTDGVFIDGGAGLDTIILSQSFTGELDLGSSIDNEISVSSDGKTTKIANFENIDARSVLSDNDTILKGDGNNNQILAGAGNDEVWMQGGTDTVSGGDGSDTYIINVATISNSGATIIDINPDDKIKFVNNDGTYLNTLDLNWIYGGSPQELLEEAQSLNTFEAWISSDGNNYTLNFETTNGLKSVNLGSEIYGAPGKWIHQDGSDFTLQPEKNIKPKFDATKIGPATTENKPVALTGSSGNYSLSLSSNELAVIDADGDALSIRIDFSGGTVSFDGSNITTGYEKTFSNPADLNAALSTLQIVGVESGRETLSISVTDTYSAEIKRDFYIEVPNSSPSISISGFNESAPPKTKVFNPISLNDAGVSVSIADVDKTADIDGRLLQVIIEVDGANATYDGNYSEFVNISGGQIVINDDGFTSIGDKDWATVLNDILGDIKISNSVVGQAEISFTVYDGEELSDDNGNNPILINFEALPLETPRLFAATDNLEKLNSSQFETGKLRVFLQDKGARVGDKIVLKTSIASNPQSDVTITIPSSSLNTSEVAPYIDIPLSDLVSGENVDGQFDITAELHVNDEKVSEAASEVVFTVDTEGASSPIIVSLNDANLGGEVTSEDITKITVSNTDGELELSHSVIRVFAPDDGSWYEFSNSFDLKSLLLGSGSYQGEILPSLETYDDINDQYELTFDEALLSGVYAVISRDDVGNVSQFNTMSFDFESVTLPDGMFVVDQSLDESSFTYKITNATQVPGENYQTYEVSGLQAQSVEIVIEGTGIAAEIPDDVVKITIQVWDAEQSRTISPSTPNIDASFTRSLTAQTDHWLLYSGSNVEISTNSSKLIPAFDLKLADAMPGVSGNIATRIILEDLAGNQINIDSQPNQILLDVTADAGSLNEINNGFVTSVVDPEDYKGVSLPDANSIEINILGIDSDVISRSSFFLTTEQIEDNLKYTADGSSYDGILEDLEIEEVLFISDAGQQLPQFSLGSNSGVVYLDINDAFVNSLVLKSDGTSKPSSLGTTENWKYINTQDGKAEYIAASDYNKFVRNPDYDPTIYVSNFVVNTHVRDQDLTSLDNLTQDISAMMPAENSPDQPLFILNKVVDRAGNVSFRDAILQHGFLDLETSSNLRIDVTKPTITEFALLSEYDTGVSSDDLVTSSTRVEFEFSANEEIASARLLQVSQLSDVTGNFSSPASYDLQITKISGGDGLSYAASIAATSVELNHGLWSLEITDMAGNSKLADASSLQISEGLYNTNVDFKSGEKGLFIVDKIGPPDAEILIENVENEGGYINQYEESATLSVSVLPGYDDVYPSDIVENQIASIKSVKLNGNVLEKGITPSGLSSGTETFNFDTNSLSQGEHIIEVITIDLAGNETLTEHTFIKDTLSPFDPINNLTVEGAGNLMSNHPVDGVLNRFEVGFDTSNKDIEIEINLIDPIGTKIVSVKVDDFELEGVPYYILSENQFGTHVLGNYVISEVAEGTFHAWFVSGDGSGGDPYSLSENYVVLTDMDRDAFGLLPVPPREQLLPISIFGGDNNPSDTGLYHFNPMEVIAPNVDHEQTHNLNVVVSDLAGNLTTVSKSFDVDTRLPIEPSVLVERSGTSGEELELSYWDTIETFNGVPGVRVKIDEAETGDFVINDTVRINGSDTLVIDDRENIFFIDSSDLLNKGGLKSLGTVDFIHEEVSASHNVYHLTATGHGVSSDGNYIILGDDVVGWSAHSVTGIGSLNDPFVVSDEADASTLTINSIDIYGNYNEIEFTISDASGNLNTFTTRFSSIISQPEDQYFAVTPTVYSLDNDAEVVNYLRLDFYLSEQALSEVAGLSEFGGTSIDLKMSLPSNIYTMSQEDVTLVSSDIFTMSEVDYNNVSDIVRWSGFVDSELPIYNKPILTIDAKIPGYDDVKDLTGIIEFSIAKISDSDITVEMDAFDLNYHINLEDLIIAPIEMSV